VIEREAAMNGNFVRKAVNWALRNNRQEKSRVNRAGYRIAETHPAARFAERHGGSPRMRCAS